jgi:hypothetical protein
MGTLRLLLRILAVLLLIVLLPLIGFFVYNRIDEAPSAQARIWAERAPLRVPDARERLGVPLRHRRRRARRSHRVRASPPRRLRSPRGEGAGCQARRDRNGAGQPAAVRGARRRRGEVRRPLLVRETDCVAWVAEHGALLSEIELRNPVRLARYQTLLGLKDFEES